MPRSKTESHKRVLEAAKEEFLEKGFEEASMRSIGQRAGMSSAGLYRHCRDKEDLFAQVIAPMMAEFDLMTDRHKNTAYTAISTRSNIESAFESGEIAIFKRMAAGYRDELVLVLSKSQGTRYENFLHKMVEEQQKEMMDFFEFQRKNGYKVMDVTENDMHTFLSAYYTAIVEPIIHNYPQEEFERCLDKIAACFMPGWMNIMGIQL